jgi:hypothetical protein
MTEENDKPESDDDRRDREAVAYWQSVAAKGGGGPQRPELSQRPGETDNEFGARQVKKLRQAGTDYWSGLAAKAKPNTDFSDFHGRGRRPRRQPTETDMAKSPSPPATDSDDINPLALIVEALRENTDATQAALAEAKATRQTMAESDQLAKRLADTAAGTMSRVIMTMEMATVSQAELDRAKTHNFYWGVAGFAAGMIILGSGIISWQHTFG